MNKIILSIVFTLVLSSLTQAQDIYYGAKVGGNVSHLFYSGDDTNFNDVSKMKLSTHIGGFVEIMLDDFFAIQPELLYSVKGARFIDLEDDDYKSSLVLKYISIPVVGKYYVTKHLDIEIGPQIAYLLSAKSVIRGDAFQSNYGDEAASVDQKDMLRDFDLGITGGVGYVFDTGFYLNARYNMGVLNAYESKPEFDDVLRNGTIQFSVGYSLNY